MRRLPIFLRRFRYTMLKSDHNDVTVTVDPSDAVAVHGRGTGWKRRLLRAKESFFLVDSFKLVGWWKRDRYVFRQSPF